MMRIINPGFFIMGLPFGLSNSQPKAERPSTVAWLTMSAYKRQPYIIMLAPSHSRIKLCAFLHAGSA